MLIRIKFAKTGPLQYVGHLDLMRAFQKAFNRANIDVKYSNGFNPHQITSFASPLGLGVISYGEYMDAELESTDSSEIMIKRLNDGLKTPYLSVLDVALLPDEAKKAMTSLAGATYKIYNRGTLVDEAFDKLCDGIEDFMNKPTIEVLKKTKKSEAVIDIKPLIYDIKSEEAVRPLEAYECLDIMNGTLSEDALDKMRCISMFLSTGSKDNLKPDLVLEELCKYANIEYNINDFMIVRTDMLMRNADGILVPLSDEGDIIR